jgi:hypothetical protein
MPWACSDSPVAEQNNITRTASSGLGFRACSDSPVAEQRQRRVIDKWRAAGHCRVHGGEAVDGGLNRSPAGTVPPCGSEMKRIHEEGQTHGEIASSYPAYDAETEAS